MRRLVLTFAAAGLLGVMAPAAALAKHHHHHNRGHHHAAAHRAVRRIGNLSPTTTPTTTTTPGTSPTKAATPTPAATVTSYSGGVLTITPTNGAGAGPISGMVTSDTRLECISMSASSTTGDNDGDESAASSTTGEHHGDDGDGNSQGQDDNGQGDDEHGHEHGGDHGMSMSSCTVSALTAGTGVLGAELMISATGAEWEKVILLTP
jgi:hypothetical protein